VDLIGATYGICAGVLMFGRYSNVVKDIPVIPEPENASANGDF
jgi:hypothetical protein